MIKIAASARGKLAKIIENEGSLPYSTVRKLLRGKDVKLNGKRVKDDLMCEKGDLIEVYVKIASPQALFADQNVAVFNKPVGLTSEDFYSQIQSVYPSARAIHRLDRNTGGIIIYALTDDAEKELLKGFKERTFTKRYLAEVKGVPSKKAAVITAYLKKNADAGTVLVRGEPAAGFVEIKTAYTVKGQSGDTSVLDVELLTGRTHQIRAHLAHIGHPIVGDGKYGDGKFNKQKNAKVQRLRAYSLTLSFKKGSPLEYLSGKTFTLPEEI